MTTHIRKLKEKSLSTLIHDLDGVFSRFIRYRDMENGRIPCFICGTKMSFQEAQCMHYIDRDQMATRYDEQNCNSGCVSCNCFDDEHREKYRKVLIFKIGILNVQRIEMSFRSLQKYMRHEIVDLIEHYEREAAILKKQKT